MSNNFWPINQNFQNQMNMNMNMNMNNMMNMNYLNMQNELLKCVIEGMGAQPSDNMATNWNTIMNYVPKFNSANRHHYARSRGPTITLNFSDMIGNKKILTIGHDNLLNEAFSEYGRITNTSNDILNKFTFLCNGLPFNMNSPGTIRENGLQDNSFILIKNI